MQEQIIELREQGLTYHEIAATSRCSLSTVTKTIADPATQRRHRERSYERMLTKAPKAEAAVDAGLDKKDPWLGMKLLGKIGVFPSEETGVIGPNVQVIIDGSLWGKRTQEGFERAEAKLLSGAPRPAIESAGSESD